MKTPNWPPGTWLEMTPDGRAHFRVPPGQPTTEFLVVGATWMRFADCRQYFQGEPIGYGTEDLTGGVLRFYRPRKAQKTQQALFI